MIPFKAGVLLEVSGVGFIPGGDIPAVLPGSSEENPFGSSKPILRAGSALSLSPELDGNFPLLCSLHGHSNFCNC